MSDDQKQGDGAPRRRRRRRRPGKDRPDAEPGKNASADKPAGNKPPGKKRRGPKRDGPKDRDKTQRGGRRPRRSRDGGENRRVDSPAALPPSRAKAAPAFDDVAVERTAPAVQYGTEYDTEPAQPIELAPDLPTEPVHGDPDPATDAATFSGQLGAVGNVVGVKFQTAGKIYLYDAGNDNLERGDEIIVDSDGGPRLGVVALPSLREPLARSNLKRVIRRPTVEDRDRLSGVQNQEREALATAKRLARALGLNIKVYRAEIGLTPSRVQIYLSSEGKADSRELVRELSRELGCRVDTRQTGVRDEAKMVGGIGSCGMELCCSTWLPAFVPVSIKNAKDQGLSLSPSKVSGQCGRLKCCLVYEQETYAELRKGMPKLGKRVVTADGEGRVVEVDVLRQRIRVSLVAGDVKIYGKGEVEPMFPPQNQGSKAT